MQPDEMKLVNSELGLINSKLDAILGYLQDQTEIRIIDGAQNASDRGLIDEKLDEINKRIMHLSNRLDEEGQELKMQSFNIMTDGYRIKEIEKKINNLSEQLSKIKVIYLPRA